MSSNLKFRSILKKKTRKHIASRKIRLRNPDSEVIVLNDEPSSSKVSGRRNEDLLATVNESKECRSNSDDSSSCASSSTVRLELWPESYKASQITGECSSLHMEGRQNARILSSPSNSPYHTKNNDTNAILLSSSDDDTGPISQNNETCALVASSSSDDDGNISSLSNLPSCIEITKVKAQKTEKFNPPRLRKEKFVLSKTMASPSKAHVQSATPERLTGLNKPSSTVIRRRKLVSVLRKRSEVSTTARTQKKSANPAAVPVVSTPRKSSKKRVMVRICRICYKKFHSLKQMNQHMLLHSDAKKNVCEHCDAEFAVKKDLEAHRKCHLPRAVPSSELVIPVVDMNQDEVLRKMGGLGMRFLIPLAELHSVSNDGNLGIPVVSVDAASNPILCDVGEMGSSNLLPVGPLMNLEYKK